MPRWCWSAAVLSEPGPSPPARLVSPVAAHPARAAAAFPDDAVAGIRSVGQRSPAEVRNFYAGADVLVVPSLATLAFREPWGLVVNEAMNQGLPVIASDRVGAAAGGLVRHERNGLVVPAGDAAALAAALRRLADDPPLRARLGAAAREDVAPYTFEAWVEGFSGALASVSASRGG
jgi:glycosyltransferase involved in cell wall biosynthesis